MLLSTDAGMWAVWDRQTFQHITGYEEWEDELGEDKDILRHIASGAFVPIYIRADGAAEFTLRVSRNPSLTDREQKYLFLKSDSYLLETEDSCALSAIEEIGHEPERAIRFKLPPGIYTVRVHMLDWNAECKDQGMDPSSGVTLPDYVILISPATERTGYRQKLDTFEPPRGSSEADND